jgi:hypothetical protein
LARLLYTYLFPLFGHAEVSGETWQLVTALSDLGDGLILVSDTDKVMTTFILVVYMVGKT